MLDSPSGEITVVRVYRGKTATEFSIYALGKRFGAALRQPASIAVRSVFFFAEVGMVDVRPFFGLGKHEGASEVTPVVDSGHEG